MELAMGKYDKRPLTDEERKRPPRGRNVLALHKSTRAELTARATEYRGIRYRSKCEAMFAMWLGLRCGDAAVVEYEPDFAELGDYTVDFVVSKPHESSPNGRIVTFGTWIEFIEYKPSRPTFTYLAEVSKNIREIITRECLGHSVKVGGFVYFGSVFNNDRGIYAIQKHDGFDICSCNWIGEHERRIREYRFDLESEVNDGR